MNPKILLAFLVSLLFSTSCTNDTETIYPRNESLYVGGFQWGEASSFNPLRDWPVSWPATGSVNLLYETLFAFNSLTGELEPLIGKNYSLQDSTLRVTLHSEAKWSDGTALTVDDILYTFYLHNQYETVNHSVWTLIESVVSNEDRSGVIFMFNKETYNPLTISDMLGSVLILPRHIFQPLEEKAKEANKNLSLGNQLEYRSAVLDTILEETFSDATIGSGPFTLCEYDSTKIVLEQTSSYWGTDVIREGKSIAPKYIIHPILADNDSYNKALEQGNLDVSATFCPMIWNLKRANVGTWESSEPYYIPGSIPSITISQQPSSPRTMEIGSKTYNTTKSVLQSASFRRSIAGAIDYEMIRKRAIQGYAPHLSAGYIINSGIEQIFYNQADADSLGVFTESTYDDFKTRQNMIKQALSDEGYTWIQDPSNLAGRLKTPSGTVVADMQITTPRGWSDWQIAVEIAVTGLRNIGVPVTINLVNEDDYWAILGEGRFDFIMNTAQADQVPSLPWSRFEKSMSSKNIDSVGVYIFANEGRYVNPVADSLLQAIPNLQTDEELEEGYRKLNNLFMQEMPVIPLMYRPSIYYQYSTTNWSGYPTIENPYTSPTCLIVSAGVKALWEIKPSQ